MEKDFSLSESNAVWTSASDEEKAPIATHAEAGSKAHSGVDGLAVIDRVTLTGADDRTSIDALVELSERFPFVEWGILASKTREGIPRYPSADWRFKVQQTLGLRLALHVCGEWARTLIRGTLPTDLNLACWGRYQLNFNAERENPNPRDIARTCYNLRHVILQINNPQSRVLWRQLYDHGHDVHALFDSSGGRGILGEWEAPLSPYGYFGYAGGLGCHNIKAQLPRIARAAGPRSIWIDMEGHLRDLDDSFNLIRCVDVLKAVEQFLLSTSERSEESTSRSQTNAISTEGMVIASNEAQELSNEQKKENGE